MSVIKMSCGECNAEKETKRITKKFESITGRSWGIGIHKIADIEKLAEDEGWVLFDPYTQMTYCPECWKSIEDNTKDDE